MDRLTPLPIWRMDETPLVTDEVERSYREQSEKLWRALLLFSADPEVANDAVAEAFAQALRRGPAVRDVDRWVWRAAFRIARGDLQHRRRYQPIASDVPGDLPTDTVDLIRALMTLTPKQRGSVVLHHYAGYSNRETAAILGATAASVGVHLERGRKRLRELLGDDDG
jgi:RNA polymerase sigma-70 factor, ECF subfamily